MIHKMLVSTPMKSGLTSLTGTPAAGSPAERKKLNKKIMLHQNTYLTGLEARLAIRSGEWYSPTAGLAPGYEQANLVVLPKEYALDFLRFCVRNRKPCPVLDVTDTGSSHPHPHLAQDVDIRTDLPRYRIYKQGVLAQEVSEIKTFWDKDFVSFLIGCSFSFEKALMDAKVPVRHIEQGGNVPMYRTNQSCIPAGIFQGPLVVSMRPIPKSLVNLAIDITSKFSESHGGPIHIGEPEQIGIMDLEKPDYGDSVTIKPGEVPVFWACGVTPQECALSAKLPLMITHAPGHMLILDRKVNEPHSPSSE